MTPIKKLLIKVQGLTKVDGPHGWGKRIDWGDHGNSVLDDKYGGSMDKGKLRAMDND